MFRTVFPSIIRSTGLHIQQQVFVKQMGKCLLLYVQSCTPDDGRKDHPKHVECHSKINIFDILVHLVGFTIEIILRCTAPLTSKDRQCMYNQILRRVRVTIVAVENKYLILMYVPSFSAIYYLYQLMHNKYIKNIL